MITGKVNPSGKLAETWPLSYEDTPAHRYYPGMERTAEYREGPYIGYRYYGTAQIPVCFPFGFGLSYTSFSYSQLSASSEGVRFTLTNTGGVAGEEVAQLYVSRREGQVFRPLRELKGFAKVRLEPGESRTVFIPLDDKACLLYTSGPGVRPDPLRRLRAGESGGEVRHPAGELRQDQPAPARREPDPGDSRHALLPGQMCIRDRQVRLPQGLLVHKDRQAGALRLLVIAAHVLDAHGHTHAPVSYTHLDVYKRQYLGTARQKRASDLNTRFF